MTDYCVALTTTGSSKEASHIAETLVDEGLVACVNIIPHVESVYFWQGKRCREKEWFLIIQMRKERIEVLKQRLLQLHSSQDPELLCLSIDDGFAAHLDWIKKNS